METYRNVEENSVFSKMAENNGCEVKGKSISSKGVQQVVQYFSKEIMKPSARE